MPRRSLVAALVPVLLIAACGSSPPSDATQISNVIKDVASHPPTLCDKYATPALLATAGGKASCDSAAAAPEAKIHGLQIASIAINGKTAIAKVSSSTGAGTLGFVKRNGHWLVSSNTPD
jgi:hypothetical protein